ncbi:MAG TPA: VOC family protein [Candidatus Stackebrandtia faecavium]|nr:VOC family protein [Candidatus Stackebrandtia faecavium]
MLRDIHHVQLTCPVGTETAVREFYTGVLQLQEIAKPPLLAQRGGCWFVGAEQSRLEIHIGVADPFVPATKGHPGLICDDKQDLDALVARLESAGCPVTWDDALSEATMSVTHADGVRRPHTTGMWRFYVNDPHGNRLEFLAPRAP